MPNFGGITLDMTAFILVIFSALVTPDGSGVTMWFVAGPMIMTVCYRDVCN